MAVNKRKLLKIILLLGTVPIALTLVFHFLLLEEALDWFPRRPPGEGVRFGKTLNWRNGTIGIYDYCTYPGSYDNQVEWHGSDGHWKVLLEVGDSIPDLQLLPNDQLRVKYYSSNSGAVTVVLRSLDAPPERVRHRRDAPDSDR